MTDNSGKMDRNESPDKKDRKLVCVQGLGYVGAAMATAITIADDEQGDPLYNVVGIDLPTAQGKQRVDAINRGKFPFATCDNGLEAAIARARKRDNLEATTEPSVYARADIIIVDIQFDIDILQENPPLHFDGLKRAITAIGQKVKRGALIIIETTVPPGTCANVVVPVLSSKLVERGMDHDSVMVAHSYERVTPGERYLESITDCFRVYAGHSKQAADACGIFLSDIVNVEKYPLTRLSSTLASETAKVMENSYRAVNIAFLDEWTKYAESVGIDMFEVVDAIRLRPTHSNIASPGCGVGGYCLPKDPLFAPAAARQLFGKDLSFPFSNIAVKVNREMPLHIIDRIKAMFSQPLGGKKILICGLAYRSGVADTRNTPAEILVRELLNNKAEVILHDPYVSYWEKMELAVKDNLPSARCVDACIFTVAHKHYRELDIANWVSGSSVIVLDAGCVFTREQRNTARQKGIRLESIGRGDGL